MLIKQYKCDLCDRSRPASNLYGVYFHNYPCGDMPPEFHLSSADDTDRKHLCKDCVDLIKKDRK